jgi:beta-xylosidase
MVYSSTILVGWSLRGVISPENNYMGADSTEFWAADVAARNGKYYFYFSDR